MVKSGQAAVATPGTAVRVSTDEAERDYILMSHPGNSGNVFLGGSNVSSANGFALASTNGPVNFFGKLSDLYVDAEQAGDKLCWLEVLS
jgi:hypothetical protein